MSLNIKELLAELPTGVDCVAQSRQGIKVRVADAGGELTVLSVYMSADDKTLWIDVEDAGYGNA